MVNELYLYSTFQFFQPLKALLQHKSAFTCRQVFDPEGQMVFDHLGAENIYIYIYTKYSIATSDLS